MKECFKCRQVKPLSEFYTHGKMSDHHLNKCKTCTCSDVRTLRLHKIADPVWLSKERARCREKSARARAAGVVMQPSREVRQNWYRRNKHKRTAHALFRRAVIKGLIKRPAACEDCGVITPELEGHHHDYSQPLNVQWLCTKCHGKTRWKDQEAA